MGREPVYCVQDEGCGKVRSKKVLRKYGARASRAGGQSMASTHIYIRMHAPKTSMLTFKRRVEEKIKRIAGFFVLYSKHSVKVLSNFFAYTIKVLNMHHS